MSSWICVIIEFMEDWKSEGASTQKLFDTLMDSSLE